MRIFNETRAYLVPSTETFHEEIVEDHEVKLWKKTDVQPITPVLRVLQYPAIVFEKEY
jgi:hypothetical protein